MTELDDRLFTLCFFPDGKHLLATGHAAQVHHIRLRDGDVVGRLKGHRRSRDEDSGLFALACDASGRLALSGGSDKVVRLWDLRRYEALAVLKGHKAPITALALDEAARRAVSADETGRVLVWDIQKFTDSSD